MVLVSHEFGFIYLKTHKTGSTSVEMFLEPLCAPPGHEVVRDLEREIISDVGIIGQRNFKSLDRVKDKSATYWFGHMGAQRVQRQLGRKLFRKYLKVACIRNPFQRLLSKYFHTLTWAPDVEREHHSLDAARAGFRAYLESADDPVKRPAQPRTDRFITHVVNGCVLDHVIRLEHMRDDLDAFLAKIGSPAMPRPLSHERNNTMARRGWSASDFYDAPDLIDRVLKLDDWVFDLGGYSRDPAHA